MKRLLLVRHAKSDWSDGGLRDFDRPLNRRGEHDAPRMARYASAQGERPTYLLTSPAARTYATARLFAAEFGIAENDIGRQESLYEGTAADIFAAVRGLPDLHESVALFAHNPGLTTAVSRISEDYVDNVPTCGVGVVSWSGASWTEFEPERAALDALWIPKAVLSAYA